MRTEGRRQTRTEGRVHGGREWSNVADKLRRYVGERNAALRRVARLDERVVRAVKPVQPFAGDQHLPERQGEDS